MKGSATLFFSNMIFFFLFCFFADFAQNDPPPALPLLTHHTEQMHTRSDSFPLIYTPLCLSLFLDYI